jgi:hypothetical protein
MTLPAYSERLFCTVIVLFCIAGAPPASACSCVDASLQDHFSRSDTVVFGLVTGLQLASTGEGYMQSSADPVAVQITPFEIYKRANSVLPGFNTVISSASCGYSFRLGGFYTIFADERGHISLCSGTFQWLGRGSLEKQQKLRSLAGFDLEVIVQMPEEKSH